MNQKKSRGKDFFVSVVSVVSNDADVLEPFVNDTMAALENAYENYEFVIVDDGSIDGTRTAIEPLLKKHPAMRYLRLPRSYGTEIAFSAGLDSAIGDVVVTMQPDDPAELLPKMVDHAADSGGVVFGVRRDPVAGQSLLYRFGRSAFHSLSGLFFRRSPPKNAAYYIALTRQTLNAVVQIRDRARFLRIFSAQSGFPTETVSYKPVYRRGRPQRKSVPQAASYALDAIIANSTAPLRFVTYLGLAAAFANLLYIGYVFAVAIVKQRVVEGWISTSLQASVMYFLLFLILGVFSEYLIRIVEESKDQPLYIVAEEKTSAVMIPNRSARRNVMKESV